MSALSGRARAPGRSLVVISYLPSLTLHVTNMYEPMLYQAHTEGGSVLLTLWEFMVQENSRCWGQGL